MQVASLELCKTLYELSGSEWITTQYVWREHHPNGASIVMSRAEQEADSWRFRNSPEAPRFREENDFYPAYDLGYLLRKLPQTIIKHTVIDKGEDNTDFYLAEYLIGNNPSHTIGNGAYTPEDATCKLAIELFKQGVLK